MAVSRWMECFFCFCWIIFKDMKWYPRSLCTRGWWLQSNRFFYHLLLSKKCHMSPTDYSQGTGIGCDLRCRWDWWFFLHSLWWRGPTVLSKWWGLHRVSPCVSSNVTQGTFPKKIRRSTKSPVAVFMTENDGKNWLPGWFMTLLLSSDPALKHLPQNQTKWYDMENIRSVHRVCTVYVFICACICITIMDSWFMFFLMEFSSLSMCWDSDTDCSCMYDII